MFIHTPLLSLLVIWMKQEEIGIWKTDGWTGTDDASVIFWWRINWTQMDQAFCFIPYDRDLSGILFINSWAKNDRTNNNILQYSFRCDRLAN